MMPNNNRLSILVCLLLLTNSSIFAFKVQVAQAPLTDLSLTVSAISGAQSSIKLNIYELSSSEISNALIKQIRAGVCVEMLVEGEPVGGLSEKSIDVQKKIIQAMSTRDCNKFYRMSSKVSGQRRFRFDHAKYTVVDGKRILIGSENYSPTGNPVPGQLGNRGWETVLSDAVIARSFSTIFTEDSDTSQGDIEELARLQREENFFSFPFQSLETLNLPKKVGDYSEDPKIPTLDASSATRILSPESSLSELLVMMDSEHATRQLDIELMTFSPKWGATGQDSPLFTAVVEAARRGVAVRVLLNDEKVFNQSDAKSKNKQTVTLLNKIAKSEKLNLAAKIADVKAMGVDYIHNKGVLIDGKYTLVSSINWNSNSVENNREAAVLIDSPEVNGFYSTLFESDWAARRN